MVLSVIHIGKNNIYNKVTKDKISRTELNKPLREILKELNFKKAVSGKYYIPRHSDKGFYNLNSFKYLKNYYYKPKYYNIKISFKFRYTDVNRKITKETDEYEELIIKRKNKKIPKGVLKSKILKFINDNLLVESGQINAEITKIKPLEIIDIKNVDNLLNNTVYRGLISYPKLKLFSGNNNGLCGYDFLLDEYPKKSKSYENLERFFRNDRRHGLTPEDFLKFCDYHKISIYLCDILYNRIIQRTFYGCNKREYEKQPIIAVIHNKHIYKVDKKMRKKVQNIITTRNITTLPTEGTARPTEGTARPTEATILPSEATVQQNINKHKSSSKEYILINDINKIEKNKINCINLNSLNKIYYEQLEKGLCYPAKWKNEKVEKIYFNDYTLECTKLYNEVFDLCKDFKVEFKNQTMSQFSRFLWYKFLDDNSNTYDFKESYFNKELKKLFLDNNSSIWTKAFKMDLTEKEINIKDVSSVDISKCYTSILTRGGFFTHSILDYPEEFNGEISHGFYYIKTNNKFPFQGDGFYDYQLIKTGLDYSIITLDDIKYQIKGTYQKSNDKAFVDFVNYCMSSIKKKNMNLFKFIINILIGSFGITKTSKINDIVITNSLHEAFYYTYKLGECSKINEIIPNIFKICSYNEVIPISSNIPINIQIVNRGNMEVFKLMKIVEKSGFIPLRINVDEVIYGFNKKKGKFKTNKNPKIGEYRQGKKTIKYLDYINQEFNPHEIIPRNYNLKELEWDYYTASENSFFDWEELVDYSRVFISGFAGSGKSYIIKKLQEYHGDKYLYASFTNMASNNINGSTLNSILGLNLDNKVSEKRLRRLINEYEGIIIDEVNQVGINIFNILCSLPNKFNIICFGDFRQETPVGENCLVNSNMFKLLMNCDLEGEYNKIILKKQCRTDYEYANFCINYHDNYHQYKNQLKNYINKFKSNDLNIVKTNNKRKQINRELNKIWSFGSSKKIKLKEGEYYIYKGLPVVCKINRLNLYNNEIYVVKNFDDDFIYLTYKNLNYDISYLRERLFKIFKIPIDFFKSNFNIGYALTTYSVEGQTISVPYTIYEFYKMNIKSRYTALTRATNSSLISIHPPTEGTTPPTEGTTPPTEGTTPPTEGTTPPTEGTAYLL